MEVRKKPGPKTPDTNEVLKKHTVMLDSDTASRLKRSGYNLSAGIRILVKKHLAPPID